MLTKILLKRGVSARITALVLADGEAAFTTDTSRLYVGNGSAKVSINPLSRPVGLNTVAFYSKTQVNAYGQIVAQDLLTASDYPMTPYTKIIGLGSFATGNVGVLRGQAPVLNANGKLPVSVLPPTVIPTAILYATTNAPLTVGGSQVIPFDVQTQPGGGFTLTADGKLVVLNEGRYLVNYNVTANSSSLSCALYNDTTGIMFSGSMCRATTSAAPLYCACNATVVVNIKANDRIALRNVGTTNILLESLSRGLTIFMLQ